MKGFVTAFLLFLSLSIFAEEFSINLGNNEIEWNLFRSYNAIEAQIFTGLHEGLVVYHPATNKPIAGAAESWELSEDNKTFTFYLREGLQYSNGDPLLAEHFRKSWLRSLDPHEGSRFASLLDVIEGASEYNRGLISKDEVGIEALSDRELVVRLKEPAPHFLSILCHYSFSVVHPLLLGLDDWNSIIHMPVNGPYRIVSRSPGKVVLEKNTYYWDYDQVPIEKYNLLFDQDPEWAMDRFNDYRLDWVLSGMDTSLLEEGSRMVFSPSFSTSYYYFSNRQDPWDRPNVRKALSLLLPWSKIREQYLIPGYTLVPPIPQYPEMSDPFMQNKEKAMTLLEEEGFPGGTGLPEIVIRVDASMWGDSVPLSIRNSWAAALDTEVRIESLPSYQYYASLADDDYTLGYISWVGDYADPMTFLQMWKADSSFNDSGYNNPEFDALLSEAGLAQSEERYTFLSQAEAMLLETAQVMPVQHIPSLHLIDLRYVEGWYPNALDIHPLKDLDWKTGVPIPGIAVAPSDLLFLQAGFGLE